MKTDNLQPETVATAKAKPDSPATYGSDASHVEALKTENTELRKALADAVRSVLEIRDTLDPNGNLSIVDAVAKIRAAMKAAKRLAAANYTNWNNAGGGKECEHGYNEGIPCPACDLAKVNDALAEREHQNAKLTP